MKYDCKVGMISKPKTGGVCLYFYQRNLSINTIRESLFRDVLEFHATAISLEDIKTFNLSEIECQDEYQSEIE